MLRVLNNPIQSCTYPRRTYTMNDQAQVYLFATAMLKDAQDVFGRTFPDCAITFSNRMTKRGGHYAYDPYGPQTHEVSFSAPLIALNDTESFCKDTVIHEVAHFVDKAINGTTGHHARFYNIMSKLGHPNPTRCHSFNTVQSKNVVDYRCEVCGEIVKVGTRKHNNMKGTGRTIYHKPCGRTGVLRYLGY
jgi:predicted SprT family Zn-dependent metalloprotease